MLEPLPPEPYKVWDIDSIFELDPPAWLIDYVIPQGGSTLLYGPTNVGKSLVSLDWAFRLASGWNWFGKHVKQSSVLYVYAEGGHDLQLRYQAWVEGHKHRQPHQLSDNLHFIGLDEEIRLKWDPESEEPPEGVRRLYESVDPEREGQRRYDVVIFDPAQEIWRGMNDNSAQEVGMAWRIVKDLQRMHDASAVILHHARKEGDTFRGATTWLDLADTGFAVTDEGHGLVKVTNTKNRYGERGHSFLLRRKRQEIEKKAKLFGQESVFLTRGTEPKEQEQDEILTVLLTKGSCTVKELEKNTNIKERSIRRRLEALVADEVVEFTEIGNTKRYRVVETKRLENL